MTEVPKSSRETFVFFFFVKIINIGFLKIIDKKQYMGVY